MKNETNYLPEEIAHSIKTRSQLIQNLYCCLYDLNAYISPELHKKVCVEIYEKIDKIQDEIDEIQQDKKIQL